MKTRNLIPAALLCLTIMSCAKRTTDFNKLPGASIFSSFLVTDTPNLYNYVGISYNRIVTAVDSGFDIVAAAGFTDSTSGATNLVQSVFINSNQLTGDSAYLFKYSDSAHLSSGKALAGNTTTVKIIGSSSADTLNSSVYVASDIGHSLSGFPLHGKANFSHAMNLTWTPDTKSSELTVIIQLYYFTGLSQQADSTLPANMRTLTYTTTDNGSFTIPATDIDTIPVKSYWGMLVGRFYEGQGKLPVSNRRVFLIGASRATLSPFIVDTL